ncbi:MAG: KH domain-containing protein, partial [Ilumatobacteraceae bacterium]
PAADPDRFAMEIEKVLGIPAEDILRISAKTGEGVEVFLDWLATRLPEGEPLYPSDVVRETPDTLWVADLVREELLSRMREELPYSIATRVTEYEWPRIRCEIVVERDSQKGMVIGKGGQVLKEVGTAVRLQLAKGAHIELVVVVDEGWQQRLDRIERLGY